jgi:hypothetical protein
LDLLHQTDQVVVGLLVVDPHPAEVQIVLLEEDRRLVEVV